MIAVGLSISVTGILYKVCMLENADIEDEEEIFVDNDKYTNAKKIND